MGLYQNPYKNDNLPTKTTGACAVVRRKKNVRLCSKGRYKCRQSINRQSTVNILQNAAVVNSLTVDLSHDCPPPSPTDKFAHLKN